MFPIVKLLNSFRNLILREVLFFVSLYKKLVQQALSNQALFSVDEQCDSIEMLLNRDVTQTRLCI